MQTFPNNITANIYKINHTANCDAKFWSTFCRERVFLINIEIITDNFRHRWNKHKDNATVNVKMFMTVSNIDGETLF